MLTYICICTHTYVCLLYKNIEKVILYWPCGYDNTPTYIHSPNYLCKYPNIYMCCMYICMSSLSDSSKFTFHCDTEMAMQMS